MDAVCKRICKTFDVKFSETFLADNIGVIIKVKFLFFSIRKICLNALSRIIKRSTSKTASGI